MKGVILCQWRGEGVGHSRPKILPNGDDETIVHILINSAKQFLMLWEFSFRPKRAVFKADREWRIQLQAFRTLN